VTPLSSSCRSSCLPGFPMSGLTQNIVYASLAIAGLMGLACLADLVLPHGPFGGQTMYDVLFLIAAGITAYMGIDCLRKG
jgi:hypothetical protein